MRTLAAAVAAGAVLLAGPALGQALTPLQTTVAIPTTGTPVMAALPANPTRKGLMICNNGTSSSVYWSMGNVAPVATTPQITNGTCLSILPATLSINVGAQVNVLGTGQVPVNVTFLEF